ncbi:hypothetical protein RHMOL_Rhmol02G0086200 [Rhododendron molle]|uniref:Uncharacterized protein n=1 Tax=Rhododendron molle TaxID=49168 RepID=A0ACC0PPP1_RHOML|nr:hypothetical protein RHMOL_Rhmol02G0086200 [Rhododendron molle]
MNDKPCKNPEEEEALRLKTLAEQKYSSSNLKSALKYAKRAHRLSPSLDGLSELLTAFQILRVAASPSSSTATTTLDWYKILHIEPFSHTNAVKKQYKKLALTLHPDKNPFPASEEAFKLVAEAFRVLSDKIRRKEYDMRLRIAMQSEATEGGGGGGVETAAADAFWTACSTCRLLHKFERKYLGHDLVCPSCKKSFKAVEVSDMVEEEDDDRVGSRSSDRVRVRDDRVGSRSSDRVRGSVERVASGKSKRKMSSVEEVLARSRPDGIVRSVELNRNLGSGGGVERSQNVDKKEGWEAGVEVMEKSKPKMAGDGEETMTLAEMQALAKRKMNGEKKKKRSKEDERETEIESEKVREKRVRRSTSKGGHLENERWRSLKSGNVEMEKRRSASKSGDLEIMAVEDSDFYNFDKDRMERSFKKGQVWAIYDDDDGMPRHYGLIDEVVSANPFEVWMSWLDLQTNGDEGLICWEKMGIHISCGRFKVARKTLVDSVNIFSHIADAERAAREVYRIYPKKGSVWALYKDNDLENEGRRNPSLHRERCYDIVVFLTSYSEIHGLSMAYLEKVEGFKTVFKRKEIGCHAIRWLEKDDVRLFSHQIPARKLSEEEAANLPKDCWELDPASLPTDLLTVAWHK